MACYKDIYKLWLDSPALDEAAKNELLSIADDEKEIEDRFYRDLEFGTAGMRGVIGIGTNRINIYNVRRATQGLAKYVLDMGADSAAKGVLIGYDTRNFSRVFAEETAKVLVANNVKAFLYPIVHSVPEVSFGIRRLGCSAGVMITASHNPKEYNGYKVYGPDGGQLPPDAADSVVSAIESFDIFNDVKVGDLDSAGSLLEIISTDIDEEFLQAVQSQQINPEAPIAVADTMKLVYTPFHGTGSRPIKEILKRIGFKNVLVVSEQDTEDGDFPTVKSPNPENKEGFTLAIELAKQNDVDLIIGTDPDCDRVGIVVRDASGEYRTLTGNQTGALLVEYILRAKKEAGLLPANGVVIKTIVTTELASAIAKAYDIEIMSLLTGFKYIGEKMTEFVKTGSHTYLIGFEESYGYLVGNHARDKDGVVATMLIAEMAAYYKTKGMSPYEALLDIYKRYGYYVEKLVSITMPGKDGMERMAAILNNLRQNPPKAIGARAISKVTDYKLDETGLPKSNVLKYEFDDQKTYFIIRPSGTEPKIKIYMGTNADSYEEGEKLLENLLADIKTELGV